MELCDYCLDGELVFVEANLPWSLAHYQCKICNSTYDTEYDIEVEFEKPS